MQGYEIKNLFIADGFCLGFYKGQQPNPSAGIYLQKVLYWKHPFHVREFNP
jgi:hypothetical protein